MSCQVVLVTGAASGIGAAIALSFAKLHAGLCIIDINEDLYKVSKECQNLSKNKVLEIVADITQDEVPESIIKNALKEFGKIDVLVNCSGIYKPTNVQDSDIIESFDKIIAINVRSIVAMTNKALPALIESKGCVINISSVCSKLIVHSNLVYSMTKAAVAIFTKCAAYELASRGIRVNCISPGAVKTNIHKTAGISEHEIHEIRQSVIDTLPLKKLVKVEEIAELAVYLASEKAASITGSDFFVDNGMALGNAVVSVAPKN